MKYPTILFSAFLLCTWCCINSGDSSHQNSSSTNNEIQYLEAVSFDDIESLFHKNNDTTYLINFWATWCKPCVEELPFIEQAVDNFQGKPFQSILVSLDFPDEIDSKFIPFIKENNLRSKLVLLKDLNYNNWIDKVDATWSGAIPATVIYNSKTRYFYEKKFASYESIESIINLLVQ